MKLEFGLGTTVQTVEVPDENVSAYFMQMKWHMN